MKKKSAIPPQPDQKEYMVLDPVRKMVVLYAGAGPTEATPRGVITPRSKHYLSLRREFQGLADRAWKKWGL